MWIAGVSREGSWQVWKTEPRCHAELFPLIQTQRCHSDAKIAKLPACRLVFHNEETGSGVGWGRCLVCLSPGTTSACANPHVLSRRSPSPTSGQHSSSRSVSRCVQGLTSSVMRVGSFNPWPAKFSGLCPRLCLVPEAMHSYCPCLSFHECPVISVMGYTEMPPWSSSDTCQARRIWQQNAVLSP